MQRNLQLFQTLLLIIILVDNSFSQPIERILKFTISMEVKKVSQDSDLGIDMHFQSLKKDGLILPKIIFIGYENDKNADIVFEVHKYNNITKQFSDKQIPVADYNFLYEKEYLILSYLQSKLVQSDLTSYARFMNGNYRVRAKFKVPHSNHYSKKNIYSNWVYFSVKDMEYPPGPSQEDSISAAINGVLQSGAGLRPVSDLLLLL